MVPVTRCRKIVKSTGAGDTLTGALVSMLLRGKSTEEGLKYAMMASRLSLESKNSESVISD
jgi:sugar/nucleoside kinase (ribokinase family)